MMLVINTEIERGGEQSEIRQKSTSAKQKHYFTNSQLIIEFFVVS